jgi:hypothetical protein
MPHRGSGSPSKVSGSSSASRFWRDHCLGRRRGPEHAAPSDIVGHASAVSSEYPCGHEGRWRPSPSPATCLSPRARLGTPAQSPFRSCGPRGPERGSDRPRRARGPRNAGKSASRPRCSWRTQSRALMTDHSLLNATDRRCPIRTAVNPARQLLRWTRRPADGRRCAHACGRMRAHPSRTDAPARRGKGGVCDRTSGSWVRR